MSENRPESVLAQWFRRVWNESDPSAIEELAAPDVVSHGLLESIHGRDHWRDVFYNPMRASFDAVQIEVLDELSGGDRTFMRLVATMTPKTTGQPVTMKGTCVARIENGRIAEAWDTWDFLGLLEGMNLLPKESFGRAITGQFEKHPLA